MFERVLRHFGWYRASDFRRSMETRSKRVLHAGVTGCMVLAPWEKLTDFDLKAIVIEDGSELKWPSSGQPEFRLNVNDGRYYQIEKDIKVQENEIVFGKLYKDRVTGFEGICTSKHMYMNGCTRIGLQSPKLHDNKPVDTVTFDFQDLQYVGIGIAPPEPEPSASYKAPGGPRDIPKTPWK